MVRVGSIPEAHFRVWTVEGTRTNRFQGTIYSVLCRSEQCLRIKRTMQNCSLPQTQQQEAFAATGQPARRQERRIQSAAALDEVAAPSASRWPRQTVVGRGQCSVLPQVWH